MVIVTKFLGPTDTKGARVKAQCNSQSVTIPWDHALSPEANHEVAAGMLYNKTREPGGLPKKVGQWFLPDQVKGWAYVVVFE